jgi:Fe-S cluster assembly protein SufD
VVSNLSLTSLAAGRNQAGERLGLAQINGQPGGQSAGQSATAPLLVPGQPIPSLLWPTSADEVWRYSRVDRLRLQDLILVQPGSSALPIPPSIGVPCATVHVVDGIVANITITAEAQAGGLTIRHAQGVGDRALLEELPAVAVDAGDTFVDLATFAAQDVVVIEVARGKTIEGVVHVINEVASSGAFIPARVVVRVGEMAALAVVERVVGEGAGSVFAPLTELQVGQAATLRFVTVQELGDFCTQLAHQQCTTGRDATLRTMAVALGGSYARIRTDAVITDQGGFNELLAVYFGAGQQMHDFRTMQHHVAPRTSSELLFKGAVEDESQSVYTGLIKIGVDAKQTVANQANRNLLLSPTATAESVPNLEIENNDVKCSHASAVGPLDEDERYYLESRGVPPEEAERLIVIGFFADVLDRSPVPGVAEALTQVFADKFAARSHSMAV